MEGVEDEAAGVGGREGEEGDQGEGGGGQPKVAEERWEAVGRSRYGEFEAWGGRGVP